MSTSFWSYRWCLCCAWAVSCRRRSISLFRARSATLRRSMNPWRFEWELLSCLADKGGIMAFCDHTRRLRSSVTTTAHRAGWCLFRCGAGADVVNLDFSDQHPFQPYAMVHLDGSLALFSTYYYEDSGDYYSYSGFAEELSYCKRRTNRSVDSCSVVHFDSWAAGGLALKKWNQEEAYDR